MASGDNGGLGLGPQAATPQVPMAKFNCQTPGCGIEVAGRMPLPQFFNLPTVSGVLFSHERITRCPNCGAAYLCMLAGLTPEGALQMVWTPVNARQQSPISAPSGSEIEAIRRSKLS